MPNGQVEAHLVGIVTTEHFTLQTARSATTMEVNGRVSAYLGAVASSIIALAFVGQTQGLRDVFHLFGLLLLAPVIFVGVVTFARTLQSGIEDAIYAKRINRLRRFYFSVGADLGEYLQRPVELDDPEAIMGQAGIAPRRIWQPFLTAGGMVAVVNSFLIGVFASFAVALLYGEMVIAVPVGAAVFVGSAFVHLRLGMVAWSRLSPFAPQE